MKEIFDRDTDLGDQVLALLPIPGSPFWAEFSGPYDIVFQVTDQDYLIPSPNRRKSTQLCHVNLLKSYCSPSSRSDLTGNVVGSAVLAVGGTASSSPMVAGAGEDESSPDDFFIATTEKNGSVE